jgi:segregation and condensation protein B
MEPTRLKSLLETLIFVSEGPVKVGELLEALEAWESAAFPEIPDTAGESGESDRDPEAQLQAAVRRETEKLSRVDVQEALAQIERDYRETPERGILLVEVANGWQFRTRPENAAILRGLLQTKPVKLSKPSLETLAIVAYRQPITRAEIDAIRGVDSGGVLKTLLEKNLVRIVGKKDEPGKPMLYGTAQEFLELFQLKSLKDLPALKEFRELEEEFHRKAGQEGVVVENVDDAEEDSGFSLDAAPVREALGALETEEEQEIEDLETSLKELRKLERDVFAEEKEETDQGPATTDH